MPALMFHELRAAGTTGPSGGTSSIPLTTQASNFDNAWRLYQGTGQGWSVSAMSAEAWMRAYQSMRVEMMQGSPELMYAAREADRCIHRNNGKLDPFYLKYTQSLKGLLSTDYAHDVVKNCAARRANPGGYTDAQLDALVQLSTTLNDDAAMTLDRVMAAWTVFKDGAGGTGMPDPANAGQDLAAIVNGYGLKGLNWFCQAVPATRFLAMLAQGAPDDPRTATWRAKLEPLVAAGVTQSGLEAVATEIAFSNPLKGLSNLHILGGTISGEAGTIAAGGGDTSALGSLLPAGLDLTTLLVLGAVIAAIWYFFFRHKG